METKGLQMILRCWRTAVLLIPRKIPNDVEDVPNAGYGVKINKGKSEVSICNRCERKKLNIRVDNEKIKEVK